MSKPIEHLNNSEPTSQLEASENRTYIKTSMPHVLTQQRMVNRLLDRELQYPRFSRNSSLPHYDIKSDKTAFHSAISSGGKSLHKIKWTDEEKLNNNWKDTMRKRWRFRSDETSHVLLNTQRDYRRGPSIIVNYTDLSSNPCTADASFFTDNLKQCRGTLHKVATPIVYGPDDFYNTHIIHTNESKKKIHARARDNAVRPIAVFNHNLATPGPVFDLSKVPTDTPPYAASLIQKTFMLNPHDIRLNRKAFTSDIQATKKKLHKVNFEKEVWIPRQSAAQIRRSLATLTLRNNPADLRVRLGNTKFTSSLVDGAKKLHKTPHKAIDRAGLCGLEAGRREYMVNRMMENTPLKAPIPLDSVNKEKHRGAFVPVESELKAAKSDLHHVPLEEKELSERLKVVPPAPIVLERLSSRDHASIQSPRSQTHSQTPTKSSQTASSKISPASAGLIGATAGLAGIGAAASIGAASKDKNKAQHWDEKSDDFARADTNKTPVTPLADLPPSHPSHPSQYQSFPQTSQRNTQTQQTQHTSQSFPQQAATQSAAIAPIAALGASQLAKNNKNKEADKTKDSAKEANIDNQSTNPFATHSLKDVMPPTEESRDNDKSKSTTDTNKASDKSRDKSTNPLATHSLKDVMPPTDKSRDNEKSTGNTNKTSDKSSDKSTNPLATHSLKDIMPPKHDATSTESPSPAKRNKCNLKPEDSSRGISLGPIAPVGDMHADLDDCKRQLQKQKGAAGEGGKSSKQTDEVDEEGESFRDRTNPWDSYDPATDYDMKAPADIKAMKGAFVPNNKDVNRAKRNIHRVGPPSPTPLIFALGEEYADTHNIKNMEVLGLYNDRQGSQPDTAMKGSFVPSKAQLTEGKENLEAGAQSAKSGQTLQAPSLSDSQSRSGSTSRISRNSISVGSQEMPLLREEVDGVLPQTYPYPVPNASVQIGQDKVGVHAKNIVDHTGKNIHQRRDDMKEDAETEVRH